MLVKSLPPVVKWCATMYISFRRGGEGRVTPLPPVSEKFSVLYILLERREEAPCPLGVKMCFFFKPVFYLTGGGGPLAPTILHLVPYWHPSHSSEGGRDLRGRVFAERGRQSHTPGVWNDGIHKVKKFSSWGYQVNKGCMIWRNARGRGSDSVWLR